MATTDWIRFAELVNQMGELIDSGCTEGPEILRVITEAGAVFHGSEPVTDTLDDAFVGEDPWALLEGLAHRPGAERPRK